MVIMIALAVIVPIVGFMIGRMENIDTGKTPSLKEGFYVGAGALTALGGAMFVIGVIVWFWSIVTNTRSTWIDLEFVFYYSLLTAGVGAAMMALTRPRQ